MATPQKDSLRVLSGEEQAALEQLGKRTSERVDRVRRARALVAVARGASFAAAARQAGFRSGTAVANLVGRFNHEGLAALRIGTGRGRKPTYDPGARAAIVATAQRPPERRADGTASWSLGTLQRMLRQGAYPRIGTSTIRRVLEQAGSSYQRTRSWCPTGTAQRVRQSGVVTVVDPQTEQKRG
jgi:transposase